MPFAGDLAASGLFSIQQKGRDEFTDAPTAITEMMSPANYLTKNCNIDLIAKCWSKEVCSSSGYVGEHLIEVTGSLTIHELSYFAKCCVELSLIVLCKMDKYCYQVKLQVLCQG